MLTQVSRGSKSLNSNARNLLAGYKTPPREEQPISLHVDHFNGTYLRARPKRSNGSKLLVG